MKRFLIIGLLITAQLLSIAQDVQKQNVTVSDLYRNYSFYTESVYGLTSMNDGIHYSELIGDSLIAKFSYKTGNKVEDVLSLNELNTNSITSINNYEFNTNEDKIIFYINRERIYRRSFTAEYFVWDLIAKKLFKVSENGPQRLATLSPNGKKVAFVRDNNIYIKELSSGQEIQITTDDEWNKIINGAPD